MPAIIGLVLLVVAYGWVDDKLKTAGLSWTWVGGAVGALIVLVTIGALIIARGRNAREVERRAEEGEERAEEIRELAADLGFGEVVQPDHEPDYHGHLSAEHMIADALCAPMFIRYHDLRGEETERVVSIERVYATKNKAKATHLRGYCHLADDRRTFRVEGIQEAADPRTGRAIADIAAYLTAHKLPVKALPGHRLLPMTVAATERAHARSWAAVKMQADDGRPTRQQG